MIYIFQTGTRFRLKKTLRWCLEKCAQIEDAIYERKQRSLLQNTLLELTNQKLSLTYKCCGEDNDSPHLGCNVTNMNPALFILGWVGLMRWKALVLIWAYSAVDYMFVVGFRP